MSTTNPNYTLLVAAKSGTSNARRVARAIGDVTADVVWATADVAWERDERSACRALAAIASEFAVRA